MAEVIDITKHMTLDDIKARDIDNLTLVYNESKEYVFEKSNQAMLFLAEAMNKALCKLGVTALERMAKAIRTGKRLTDTRLIEKQIDRQMRDNNVVQEHRVYGREAVSMLQQAEVYEQIGNDAQADTLRQLAKRVKDEIADAWRSGTYFYHNNEIAYFIADPIIRDKSRAAIFVPGQKEYVVVTNVPMKQAR